MPISYKDLCGVSIAFILYFIKDYISVMTCLFLLTMLIVNTKLAKIAHGHVQWGQSPPWHCFKWLRDIFLGPNNLQLGALLNTVWRKHHIA